MKVSSLEWFSNETLQLQRMAHEELGLGGVWSGCTGPGAIPVTDKGELLGVLDVLDPGHPRLVNIFKRSAPNTKSSNDVQAPIIEENNDSVGETSGSQSDSQGSGTVTMIEANDDDNDNAKEVETHDGDNDNAKRVETYNSGSSTVTKVETSSETEKHGESGK